MARGGGGGGVGVHHNGASLSDRTKLLAFFSMHFVASLSPLYVCLSLCLSLCLSVCLPVCLSVCLLLFRVHMSPAIQAAAIKLHCRHRFNSIYLVSLRHALLRLASPGFGFGLLRFAPFRSCCCCCSFFCLMLYAFFRSSAMANANRNGNAKANSNANANGYGNCARQCR